MIIVRLSAMLLVASTLPALGQIHYTPSVQRYRLHSTVERSQEQNGQKTSGVITNEQQVTLSLQAPGRERHAHGQGHAALRRHPRFGEHELQPGGAAAGRQVMQGTQGERGACCRRERCSASARTRRPPMAWIANRSSRAWRTSSHASGHGWRERHVDRYRHQNFSKDGTTHEDVDYHRLEGDRGYDGAPGSPRGACTGRRRS